MTWGVPSVFDWERASWSAWGGCFKMTRVLYLCVGSARELTRPLRNRYTYMRAQACVGARSPTPSPFFLRLSRREGAHHPRMGLTYRDGQLLATTHIAMLAPDGRSLRMPRRTEYVILEIGCSDWDTLDEKELDKHQGRGFLVSFEPLLDKYAVLLARGTQRYHGTQHDMAVPLAHHHRHGVVLPLAVSPAGGPVNITVHKRAGCSSLLRANRTATATWGGLCRHVLETRHVESVSLQQAMRLAGPPSMPIRHLKIDAQGIAYRLHLIRAPMHGARARSPFESWAPRERTASLSALSYASGRHLANTPWPARRALTHVHARTQAWISS